MKQIVDKLNKIAKKINENVELSDRDLIIDSLDSITKAYGGTPNDSTLIVDKLDDIYNNIGSAPSGNIEITENGENINVAPYATATVNVAGGGGMPFLTAKIINNSGYSMNQMQTAEKAEYGLNSYHEAIPANSTAIKEYLYVDSGDTFYYVRLSFTSLMQGNALTDYSELVNCTYNEEMGDLEITDPTENASVTLTLTLES